MRLIVLWFWTAFCFVTINSCKDNGVGPDIEPGRRDYTWTVDAIKIPFTTLGRIWGTGPDDLWAVGPGGGLDKTIWHFDGELWKSDGVSRGISPLSVFGFSENNVWLSGREGRIWHYNGVSWLENKVFDKSGGWNIGFQEIWGDAQTNLYATGYADSANVRKAIIAHYNGNNWIQADIPFIPDYNFIKLKKGIINNYYYLLGIKDNPTSGDIWGIFEYDGKKNIKLIYEGLDRAFVQSIDGQMLFVIGNKINKYINNQFTAFTQINEPNFGLQIFGRNEKDILLRMEDGVAHFNGSNVEYLYKFNNRILLIDGIVFENDAVFLALDIENGGNLIFRGELK